jgi:hypothetical protein
LAETRTAGPEGRIDALRAEGRRHLDAGRHADAVLVFERVLLLDPGDEVAREGLARSRAATSEAERDGRARIDAADAALARGDRALARQLLEELLDAGVAFDAALLRLEKLDDRDGLVTLPAPYPTRRDDAAPLGAPPARPLSRRAFGVFWCLLVATLGASVAFSWDRLVGQLVEAPVPDAVAVPPATRLPEPTPGERALSQARSQIEGGDVAAALASLDRIEPADAVYPFARQLRDRLARGGAAR